MKNYGLIGICLLMTAVAFSEAPAQNTSSMFASKFFKFYSPYSSMEPSSLAYANFSVPGPVVILDPLVIGMAKDRKNKTVIQQGEDGNYWIQVSGTVYDPIADIVPDGKGNIKTIAIGGWDGITIPVETIPPEEQHTVPQNEISEEQLSDQATKLFSPFPFVGRFKSELIRLPISGLGHNSLAVHVKNVSGKEGVSSITFEATIDQAIPKISKAQINNQVDFGLFDPVLVYIDDPEVNPDNVHQAKALLNGIEIGLKYVDGQLQLDRPLLGINQDPPKGIPNLVNVTGNPSEFLIEYKGYKQVLSFGYTM